MRNHGTYLCLLAMIVLSSFVAGCQWRGGEPASNLETSPSPLDEPVSFRYQGVDLELLETDLRRSYQTYYLMNYPPEGSLFFQTVLAVDGVEEPVTWGEENLRLEWGAETLPPVFARPVTIGEGYQYLSDEPLQFVYEFFFVVPVDGLPEEPGLIIAQEATLPLPQMTPTSGEATARSTRPAQPEPVALSGWSNQARAEGAVVVGGRDNQAGATFTSVGGGYLNQASQAYGTAAGGRENIANGFYAVIGGGYANQSDERETTIGGGSRNLAGGRYASIGGGIRNQAQAASSAIAGGAYNQADGLYSAVGGGTRNLAEADAAVVAGGAGNRAGGEQAAVLGGLNNQAVGRYSSAVGGYRNEARGEYAVTLGGEGNQALADHSLAAGRFALAMEDHQGALVLSDSQPFDFPSVRQDELAVRAIGGVRLITAIDSEGAPLTGSLLPPGSGSWSMLSDAASKQGWQPVDPANVLRQVNTLSIGRWNYVGQPAAVQHLGPSAQDFQRAFGLGESDRAISSVDADGVALAAIQGLSEQGKGRDRRLEELEGRLQRLEQELMANQEAETKPNGPSGFMMALSWLLFTVVGFGLGWMARRISI